MTVYLAQKQNQKNVIALYLNATAHQIALIIVLNLKNRISVNGAHGAIFVLALQHAMMEYKNESENVTVERIMKKKLLYYRNQGVRAHQ